MCEVLKKRLILDFLVATGQILWYELICLEGIIKRVGMTEWMNEIWTWFFYGKEDEKEWMKWILHHRISKKCASIFVS